MPFILVGNKADLAGQRQVSARDAELLARDWGCPYVETSAKTRQNVDEVYARLMRAIRDGRRAQQAPEAKKKGSGCVIL